MPRTGGGASSSCPSNSSVLGFAPTPTMTSDAGSLQEQRDIGDAGPFNRRVMPPLQPLNLKTRLRSLAGATLLPAKVMLLILTRALPGGLPMLEPLLLRLYTTPFRAHGNARNKTGVVHATQPHLLVFPPGPSTTTCDTRCGSRGVGQQPCAGAAVRALMRGAPTWPSPSMPTTLLCSTNVTPFWA